jgi:hypothetical protein
MHYRIKILIASVSIIAIVMSLFCSACTGSGDDAKSIPFAHFYFPEDARGTYYFITEMSCGLKPERVGDTAVYRVPAKPGIVMLQGKILNDYCGRAFFMNKRDCNRCRLIDRNIFPKVAQDGSDTEWDGKELLGAWRNYDVSYVVVPNPTSVSQNTNIGYNTFRATVCTYDSLHLYPDPENADTLQAAMSAQVKTCRGWR